MLVELPPMLLSTLKRVNTLYMALIKEDNPLKAARLEDEHGRERAMLLELLNQAVDASEETSAATTK